MEENKPVSANEWETVKRDGDTSIKKWIDDNMNYRSCVVVLIGSETDKRPWVQYEIQRALKEKKGLLGIYIHNIKCPRDGKGTKGINPFNQFKFKDGTKLSSKVSCYNPSSFNAYNEIKNNIENWIEQAIEDKN